MFLVFGSSDQNDLLKRSSTDFVRCCMQLFRGLDQFLFLNHPVNYLLLKVSDK